MNVVAKYAARAAVAFVGLGGLMTAAEARAEVTVSQYRKMKDDPVVTLYMSALIQGVQAYGATLESADRARAFCPPSGAAREQYLKALDGFLADRKAAAVLSEDQPIGGALMLAMTKAWPCPLPK